MVAALCAWHTHHRRAAGEIERRLAAGEVMVVAGAALIETYALLTRLPPPHRLSPADSRALLEANFIGNGVETVALEAAVFAQLVLEAPDRGIAGGRTYDAMITACARQAHAGTLLILNPRRFDPPSDGMLVLEPASAGSRGRDDQTVR